MTLAPPPFFAAAELHQGRHRRAGAGDGAGDVGLDAPRARVVGVGGEVEEAADLRRLCPEDAAHHLEQHDELAEQVEAVARQPVRVGVELLVGEEDRRPGSVHREERRDLEDRRRRHDAEPEEARGVAAEGGDLLVDAQLGEPGEIVHPGEERDHREAYQLVHGRDVTTPRGAPRRRRAHNLAGGGRRFRAALVPGPCGSWYLYGMTQEPGGAPGGDDPLLGAVLAGRYRLLEKLGEGGMGAVYRGVHETLRKPVAVKVLPRAARANREMVTRFEREAVAAANLKHPNIAEATDSGQMADGTLFMVMEFVEGRTLAALMAQGRLAPGRALHVLRQIGAAVTFAHGREVVHRDLKPANVVVFDWGDERDLVKVIDFGIARMRSSFGGGTSGLTKAGSVVGTVEYMAPEQAMGQAVDARADQYALGVIAFEMLTGQPPYIADDVAALVFMHVGAPIPSVTSRAPELAAYRGLDEVVAKMMGKLPDERFPALTEAIAALGSALEGPRLTPAAPAVPITFTQPLTARPALTGRGTIISVPPLLTQPNVLGATPAPQASPFPISAAPMGAAPRPPASPVATPPPATHRRELPIVLIAVMVGLVGLAILAALIINLVNASATDPAPPPTASAAPAEAPTEAPFVMPGRPPTGLGPGLHDKGRGKGHGKGK